MAFFAKARLRRIYIRSCHWQLFRNLCEQCSAFEALSLGNCITLVCAARHAQYSVQYQGRYSLKQQLPSFISSHTPWQDLRLSLDVYESSIHSSNGQLLHDFAGMNWILWIQIGSSKSFLLRRKLKLTRQIKTAEFKADVLTIIIQNKLLPFSLHNSKHENTRCIREIHT